MADKKIAVVIPAYNEKVNIASTIQGVLALVNKVVVVDDASKDETTDIVGQIAREEAKVILIEHEKNAGVGASIATGYKWCRDNDIDVSVVMAGDGQMDVADFEDVVGPVLRGEADYTKGNRLFTGEAFQKIPRIRYFGNSVLSMLTKIASGYWHVADSQSGYTAISKQALHTINWDKMYKRYGQPNDLLVRLNVYNFRVKDVTINPVYNVGEKSGIRIGKVMFTIPWLLFRLFLWRLKEKYIIRDFHPLVFFYSLGYLFFILTILLFARLGWMWYEDGKIPSINALAAMFSFMSASLFTLFAMWFDMESNKDLKA